jgi:hypothetical protein
LASQGFEPSSKTPDIQHISAERGAKLGAIAARDTIILPDDPELLSIIEAWPTLPEPVRIGIRAMVEASKGMDHV